MVPAVDLKSFVQALSKPLGLLLELLLQPGFIGRGADVSQHRGFDISQIDPSQPGHLGFSSLC